MYKKAYNAPFWVMLFVVFILLTTDVAAYIVTHHGNFASGRTVRFNLWTLLWFSLLIAETILYRVIRKRITNRFYVWAHIILIMVTFVILPVTGVLSAIQARTLPPMVYSKKQLQLAQVRFYVFWASIIIGHAFFIATMIKSFSRKPVINDEPPGILDGIIDED
jgi:hypothetical protein